MSIDISKLTQEERQEIISVLVSSSSTEATLRIKPKQIKSNRSKNGGHDTPFNRKGAIELTSTKVFSPKPRTCVNPKGHFSEFYCGACSVLNSTGQVRKGRRLISAEELETHKWRSHPHFPYFGKWPFNVKVEHCIPAHAVSEALDLINDRLADVDGVHIPKAVDPGEGKRSLENG